MTPGQVADVVAQLDGTQRTRLLNMLEPKFAEKIKSIFERQEQSIVNYCTVEIITCGMDKSAAEMRSNFQNLAKNKDVIMYLYIVDAQNRLAGVMDLKELLVADDSAKMKDVMTEAVITLNEQSMLKDAVEMFDRYGFRAIPVVDDNKRIVGVLQYKDTIKLQQRGIE
jgi:Mg/Co/Ni transporter MgtE